MLRRPDLLAASLLLALVMVGCDGGDPEAEPSAAVSPGASTSPAATDAPSPTEPSPTTKPLGPVQTVKAWVKARNVTVQTGDTEGVYALSSATCRRKTCGDSVGPVAKVHERGGRYETFGWRIVKVGKDPDFRQNQTVIAGLKYTAGVTWPSEDAEPVEYDAEKRLATFELVEEGNQWLIDAIVYVD